MVLFLLSCKSGSKQLNLSTKNNLDSIRIDSTKNSSTPDSFDWSMPRKMMDTMVRELSDPNSHKDKIVVQFLKDYNKLTERFSESLYNLPNYDELNTLSYAPDGVIKQSAKDFQKKVIDCGLNITSSEGDTYIIENTDFIKDNCFKYLDDISLDFMNLYCNEIDTVCCDDASIVIPLDNMVLRAFEWGELAKKVAGTAYSNFTEDYYETYISLIFSGVDNTMAFDYETNKYDHNLFDLMIKTIDKHPTSKAAIDFKFFTDLLTQNNLQKTGVIEDYLKKRLKK